jgi:hypothetical protein
VHAVEATLAVIGTLSVSRRANTDIQCFIVMHACNISMLAVLKAMSDTPRATSAIASVYPYSHRQQLFSTLKMRIVFSFGSNGIAVRLHLKDHLVNGAFSGKLDEQFLDVPDGPLS